MFSVRQLIEWNLLDYHDGLDDWEQIEQTREQLWEMWLKDSEK